jgi:hypothetical protein
VYVDVDVPEDGTSWQTDESSTIFTSKDVKPYPPVCAYSCK